MSNSTGGEGTGFVEVRVDRLFELVEAALHDGLGKAIVERFGDEVILLTPEQAAAFKTFVRDGVVSGDAQSPDARTGRRSAGPRKLAGPRLKAALPDDCDHCTPRR